MDTAVSAESVPQFLTLGQIAARLQVSTHRLKYAIDQHPVPPRIERALAKVAENRKGLHNGHC